MIKIFRVRMHIGNAHEEYREWRISQENSETFVLEWIDSYFSHDRIFYVKGSVLASDVSRSFTKAFWDHYKDTEDANQAAAYLLGSK